MIIPNTLTSSPVMSRRLFVLTAYIFSVAVILLLCLFTSRPAQAVDPDWSAGNIISNDVFQNYTSLSSDQIQGFLNAKVPTCDTWGTQPSEFGGGTRRQWGEARGYMPPYTCLKDYSIEVPAVTNICGGRDISGGTKTAAQIIYDVSQTCRINPQVLLVLLQKEQGLITDTWPIETQYRSATGYGCPDTAQCDAQYYGLANQVLWSGRMFRAILEASPTWYTPYILGNNYIQYNPQASCGGSNVTIQNRATQALYNYTPYQPNAAALETSMGVTVNCGAYGNLNFFRYFKSWFGSTQIPISCTGDEPLQTFVRRFYNPRTAQHFYSAYDCDIRFLERLGYTNEGAVFNTTPASVPWAVPIYRYYNPVTQMHVWSPTLSTPEELLASNTGYRQEAGIVFYVARSDMPNLTPIVSFYNPSTYRHVLGPNPSAQEITDLKRFGGYDLETTVFYAQ